MMYTDMKNQIRSFDLTDLVEFSDVNNNLSFYITMGEEFHSVLKPVVLTSIHAAQVKPGPGKPATEILISKLFDSDKPHTRQTLIEFLSLPPLTSLQLEWHNYFTRRQINHHNSIRSITLQFYAEKIMRWHILHSHIPPCNLSFEQATYPWYSNKLSFHPFSKRWLCSDLSNFRPIWNLHTVGKILECLTVKHLFLHISVSPS